MIYGNSMNNIWRNARHLNNLVTQIETGKRIQRPSDDPLIAARSLRYRTILSEAEQFSRNVQQGMAWMDVSESAFNNILTGSPTNPSLMQRIYERLVQGAQTGTQEIADQLAILTEMRQFFDQMFNVDMNQTYLGRYVFSGFHTNQPPVLKQDWPDRSFVIQQSFQPSSIETAKTFHRATPTSLPQDMWMNVIKLPFTNVDFGFDTAGVVAGAPLPQVGVFLADGTELFVENFISTEENAYRPQGDFYIHHIVDTGELVMSDALRARIEATGGLNIVYEKNDLRAGELNPIVYFDSFEIVGDESRAFSTAGQNIQMEISPMSYITINSHARDILTAELFADMRRLFEFADTLVPSDPGVIRDYFRNPPHSRSGDDLENAVLQFLSDEKAAFSGMMHIRMNNMLEAIMIHSTQAQREHTNLGSRMARMEMVGIRLEEDEVAYTDLLSQNEDTDLASTIMRKNGAEAAFGHALMAIARTTQLSLADFINR